MAGRRDWAFRGGNKTCVPKAAATTISGKTRFMHFIRPPTPPACPHQLSMYTSQLQTTATAAGTRARPHLLCCLRIRGEELNATVIMTVNTRLSVPKHANTGTVSVKEAPDTGFGDAMVSTAVAVQRLEQLRAK